MCKEKTVPGTDEITDLVEKYRNSTEFLLLNLILYSTNWLLNWTPAEIVEWGAKALQLCEELHLALDSEVKGQIISGLILIEVIGFEQLTLQDNLERVLALGIGLRACAKSWDEAIGSHLDWTIYDCGCLRECDINFFNRLCPQIGIDWGGWKDRRVLLPQFGLMADVAAQESCSGRWLPDLLSDEQGCNWRTILDWVASLEQVGATLENAYLGDDERQRARVAFQQDFGEWVAYLLCRGAGNKYYNRSRFSLERAERLLIRHGVSPNHPWMGVETLRRGAMTEWQDDWCGATSDKEVKRIKRLLKRIGLWSRDQLNTQE